METEKKIALEQEQHHNTQIIDEDYDQEKQSSLQAIEGMNLKQASEMAKKRLAEAIHKKANAVNSIAKEGDTWIATVEMVDEVYLPEQNFNSMNDVIGVYDITLSSSGELLSWNKRSSRRRGDISKG